MFVFFSGMRLTVYSYRHYLYKQLKTPGKLHHTVYWYVTSLITVKIQFIETER